jgi:endoglucanase
MKKHFCTLLLLLLCLYALPISAHASAVSKNGQLSVKGTHIVNESGKAFTIKGVSTHGLSWYPQYVNKKSFRSLKKMGANTVRLAMYTAEYNGYCVGGEENRKKLISLIDDGVQYATNLGMYVIIDWHILNDGNPMTYQSQAKTFFKRMAKKYASYNNVLFEICNEPNGSDGSWSNIKKYAASVIQTIRSVNKKAIIIVGTPTWSQDVDIAAADRISGTNIAYSFHFYAATHKDSYRSKLESAVSAGLPVIVTEFSISEASGNGTVSTSEGNKWIRLLNKYKIGRVCWNLSNKDESSALIRSSCTKTYGWKKSDLTPTGQWLAKTYGK